VYLLRVVEREQAAYPKAKIPTVLFPAADPYLDVAVDAVADEFTHPEYVYLLRVVDELGVCPNAKIPIDELPAADCDPPATDEEAPDDTTQPEYVYLFLIVDAFEQTNPKTPKPQNP